MSYANRIVGEWTISPGLAYVHFKDVVLDPDKALIAWKVSEELVDTDDGVLTKKIAIGITTDVSPHYGDGVRDTGLEDQLDVFNNAITWAAHNGPYQKVSGEIQRQGETSGDVTSFIPMEPTGGQSPYSYYKRKALMTWDTSGDKVELL
jgi:hypothetical protein